MPGKPVRRKGRPVAAIVLLAVSLTALSGVVAFYALQRARVEHVRDRGYESPRNEGTGQEEAGKEDTGKEDTPAYPIIDWTYWQQTNPEIVGWITVPGTTIDYPVVQPGKDDPYYYLDHDVYGNWNLYGCVYLSSGCPDGFESENAALYAHHIGFGDTLMFAPVASYCDPSFAREHAEILLQTPGKRYRLHACAAETVDATRPTRELAFPTREHYKTWLRGRMEEATVIQEPDEMKQVFTLTTCSYTRWANERTIVYAQEKKED